MIAPIVLCPHCGHDLGPTLVPPVTKTPADWASILAPGITPICPGCAELLVLDGDLRLREPTAAEIAAIGERGHVIGVIQDLMLDQRLQALRRNRR